MARRIVGHRSTTVAVVTLETMGLSNVARDVVGAIPMKSAAPKPEKASKSPERAPKPAAVSPPAPAAPPVARAPRVSKPLADKLRLSKETFAPAYHHMHGSEYRDAKGPAFKRSSFLWATQRDVQRDDRAIKIRACIVKARDARITRRDADNFCSMERARLGLPDPTASDSIGSTFLRMREYLARAYGAGVPCRKRGAHHPMRVHNDAHGPAQTWFAKCAAR